MSPSEGISLPIRLYLDGIRQGDPHFLKGQFLNYIKKYLLEYLHYYVHILKPFLFLRYFDFDTFWVLAEVFVKSLQRAQETQMVNIADCT